MRGYGRITTRRGLVAGYTAIPGSPTGITPTQTGILNALASDWAMQEVLDAQTLLPAITSWKRVPIGYIPGGVTSGVSTIDAAIEGGAFLANNAAAATYIAQSVFQTPKSGKWWIAAKCKLTGGGVAGHSATFGVQNAAGSHYWAITRAPGVSTTKYDLQMIGSSTVDQVGIINADNNEHVFRLFFDGTTVNSYIDRTLDAQQATIAQMTDEPVYPIIYSQTVKETAIEDCVVGFIG